jgi:hypothetical protein
MIIKRTERLYKKAHKTWLGNGNWDKETHNNNMKRVTYWLLFIPIYSNCTIVSSQI